jgi:hypothetical protein
LTEYKTIQNGINEESEIYSSLSKLRKIALDAEGLEVSIQKLEENEEQTRKTMKQVKESFFI